MIVYWQLMLATNATTEIDTTTVIGCRATHKVSTFEHIPTMYFHYLLS